MKARCWLCLLIVAAIMSFSGCTTFRADGLSYDLTGSGGELVTHFRVVRTVHEFLGTSGGENLFNISSEAMRDVVSSIVTREIQRTAGNAARNISIRYNVNVLHWLANRITFRVWAPARLTVEGDIVRIKSGTAMEDTEREIYMAMESANMNLD